MEQYIPYSLLCDLFSRNLETYLQIDKYLEMFPANCLVEELMIGGKEALELEWNL